MKLDIKLLALAIVESYAFCHQSLVSIKNSASITGSCSVLILQLVLFDWQGNSFCFLNYTIATIHFPLMGQYKYSCQTADEANYCLNNKDRIWIGTIWTRLSPPNLSREILNQVVLLPNSLLTTVVILYCWRICLLALGENEFFRELTWTRTRVGWWWIEHFRH